MRWWHAERGGDTLHTGHDKFANTGLSQTCKRELEFNVATARAREIMT